MLRRVALVAFAVVVATACGGGPPQSASPSEPQATAGSGRTDERDGGRRAAASPAVDAAPDFTVTTFDGARFTLSAQRGRPVVLNFWESW